MSNSPGYGGTRSRPAASAWTFTAEDTVADVSRRPEALDALKRLGVNHCCGAHLTLAEAAAAAGLPLDDLLATVNAGPMAQV